MFLFTVVELRHFHAKMPLKLITHSGETELQMLIFSRLVICHIIVSCSSRQWAPTSPIFQVESFNSFKNKPLSLNILPSTLILWGWLYTLIHYMWFSVCCIFLLSCNIFQTASQVFWIIISRNNRNDYTNGLQVMRQLFKQHNCTNLFL